MDEKVALTHESPEPNDNSDSLEQVHPSITEESCASSSHRNTEQEDGREFDDGNSQQRQQEDQYNQESNQTINQTGNQQSSGDVDNDVNSQPRRRSSTASSLPHPPSLPGSPLASPIQSPPAPVSGAVKLERRRSSLAPPDSELITVSKRGSRSGSRSPRRGSQTYLMGDDTIMVQLETGKRRLSSFCASSNDETMITIDDSLTEEEIMETLKAHKQIISNIKTQNWPMHRKLKILRRAKLYIKKHEGDLKQSKQAKDIVAKYRTYLEKTINRLKREINNLVVQLTPWEMRIKKIESQFGSVVASYFTFLRWIFWINTFISISMCVFLMVPEILRGGKDPTQMRKFEGIGKNLTFKEMINTAWNFDGYLKYSPIFYGYYENEETTSIGYRLPLAYFGASFLLYAFSFFCILRKMAQNARNSRVGSKDDEYVFTWKLFTGWDFMIGNSETAYNKVASIVMGFKEVILEEKEKKKETKDWKIIVRRIIANILVLLLLASSAYAVVLVVQRSLKLPENPGFFRENEVTIVVSGISTVYPNIFNTIALLEAYHPRIALRWQLGRILILNLLNLYTFMFSTFGKIDDMTAKLTTFKKLIKDNSTSLRSSTTLSGNFIESDAVTLRILNSLSSKLNSQESSGLKRNRREPHEGRLFPPDEVIGKITRGDMEFIMTTESTTFDPYARNDLDEEEPIDGRYLSGTRPTVILSTNSSPYDPGGDLISGQTEGPVKSTINMSILYEEEMETSSSLTTGFQVNTTTPSSTTGLTVRLSTLEKTRRPQQTSASTPINRLSTNTSKVITRRPINVEETSKNGLSSPMVTTPLPGLETTTLSCIETTTQFTYTANDILQLSQEDRNSLRDLCWETMFGQELAKIMIMDLLITVATTVIFDYGRALFVRYCNDCSCIFWDLEKQYPGYADFQIAENILHLVNNQANIWLGMFFSPGLPALNTIKLCILMYLRSWAVLTSNIPHETVFKASGSNNFYYALLLLMLFICTLPVGYAVVWLEPSWHCGPFSGYDRIYRVFTKYLESKLPDKVNAIVDYLTSPGSVIPIILLMILIIYYLMSTVSSLREANNDLKNQIRKEKDIQEGEEGVEAGGQSGLTVQPIEGILTPGLDKKHVRISDDITTDSDKAKLLGRN